VRPGRRALLALLGLCLVALAVPWLPWLTGVLGGGLLVLFGTMATEASLQGPLQVTLPRRRRAVLSLDEEEELPFTLWSNSTRPLSVVVRQPWPPLLTTGSFRGQGRLLPGSALTFTPRVHPVARGRAALSPPWVALSWWGFAERLRAVGEPGELTVLPNLKAVARLRQRLDAFVLRGQGARVAPRRGKGREFDRLRELVQDDDYRDVAWKASARHGKLIVKEYRLERAQDLLLCVDRGHRMAARTTRISRLDHALDAALQVAYLSHRQEDRIGALCFAADVEQGVPQGKGTAQLRRLTELFAGAQPELLHTDYRRLAVHVRRRLRSRALVLIFTTLPERETGDELVAAVRSLLPTHLPLVIVLSDPGLRAAAEVLPADEDELARVLVARDLWEGQQEIAQRLRRLGAWVIQAPPEDAGVEAVNAYLEIKRRQRL